MRMMLMQQIEELPLKTFEFLRDVHERSPKGELASFSDILIAAARDGACLRKARSTPT